MLYSTACGKCGATRIDQQIGLEDTPEAYIARLVEVFREVKRVLRDDGTLWVNIGDSYAGYWGDKTAKNEGRRSSADTNGWTNGFNMNARPSFHTAFDSSGVKPKDLIGIPWMLAFALRADGWWLRADLIWHKPNCMPESVEDRPTKSHEYIFLLSKSERYYYDADAIREPLQESSIGREERKQRLIDMTGIGTLGKQIENGVDNTHGYAGLALARNGQTGYNPAGRNKRSVWTVSTMPYSEAHFTTFPPKLIEPCILAGSSPRACEHCGAPWERVTEATGHINKREPAHAPNNCPTKIDSTGWAPTKRATDAWQPTCSHTNDGTAQCIVLDPFCGAGTVPLVSIQHHRAYIGIELNPEYVKLIQERIDTVQPVLWEIPA